MKTTPLIIQLITALAVLAGRIVLAAPASSSFQYQGLLQQPDAPANGVCDLQFSLWAASTGGTQVGPTQTTNKVSISEGLFQVELDFGADAFAGDARWLEIAVRFPAGSGSFTALSPRQAVLCTPYALHAMKAGQVPAASIAGTIADAQLSANIPRLNGSAAFSGTVNAAGFTGNGAGLSNLNSPNLTGPLTVSVTPTAIGHIDVGGDAQGVAVAGHYCYLASRSAGLWIYDVSHPANAINVGHINGIPHGVAVAGNYCYLATDGLRIYGISNPANPLSMGHTNDGWIAYGVAVSDNYCYLASYTNGLHIYDIANPASPIRAGAINNGGSAYGVAVAGRHCYLANYDDGLRVYDIFNPAKPANVGHINNGGEARGVAVAGNYCYLANGSRGLRIYDISNPANPVNVGHVNHFNVLGVTVAGNYCYLACHGGGLRIYDISNPASPVKVGEIDDGGWAFGVAVAGNYCYLANWDDGLRIYGVGLVSAPANNTIQANARCATVAGGERNSATNYAFAAGYRAKALHSGAFVWGDSGFTDIASTNANSVTMRASGGYRLFSNSGATAGVYLRPWSTAWEVISDRNVKKDFAPVDGLEVLEKLAALPITYWRYEWETEDMTSHIGPMAQDFKAAFYPGREDKGITTLEADGVALAAIQGLNAKLEDRSQKLEAENERLMQELAELKALVKKLAEKLNGGGQ